MTAPGHRWLPIVATATLSLVAGVAIGGLRASAPVPPAGADAPGARPVVGATGDTRSAAEQYVPGRDDAIRAAVLLATAFDGPGLLDDERRRRLLVEHAATAHRHRLALSLDDVARRIRDELDLEADELDGPDVVWRAVPAGVRVPFWSPDRAVVEVWGTGVVVVPDLPLVQPGWHTTRVELVRERGAWRLVEFRSQEGPTPPAVGGTDEASQRAQLIADFAPLPDAAGSATGAG